MADVPMPEPVAWLVRRSDWPPGVWEPFKGASPPGWAHVADPLYSFAAFDARAAAEREKARALVEALQDAIRIFSPVGDKKSITPFWDKRARDALAAYQKDTA